MKNKILIAIVAGIILVLLGGPFLSGIFVERQIMALQESSFWPKKNGVVTISDYDRGWFSSKAVIEYKIPFEFANLLVKEEYRTEEDHTWSIPIEISHGPIIFGDGGIKTGMASFFYDLNFPPYPEDERAEEFPDQVAITTDTLITLGGVFLSHTTIPAGTWNQQDGVSSVAVEFGGYEGVTIFDPATGQVQMAGPWPDILVTVNTKDGATLEFSLKGMALDFDVTLLNEYLWLGKTDFEMGELGVNITENGNVTVLEWFGLELHDNMLAGKTEDLLNDENTFSIKQLSVRNSENNIDFTLSDFSSDSELKNLPIEAYSILMDQLQAVGDTPELANSPEFQEQLLSPLEQLINAGLEWNINSLSFETNYGGGLYAHKFSVNPLDRPVTDMASLLQGFLSLMVWDANLELDPDLATKLAESILKGQVDAATWAGLDDAAKAEAASGMIQQFVDQGLVVAGERYSVSAKIESGILLIGDTPVFNIMDAIPPQ